MQYDGHMGDLKKFLIQVRLVVIRHFVSCIRLVERTGSFPQWQLPQRLHASKLTVNLACTQITHLYVDT